MKKTILLLLFLATTALNPLTTNAQSLKDILKGVGAAVANDSTRSAGSDSSSAGSGLGKLGDLIGNMVANNKFEIDDLVGSWKYVSPGVSFKSDNALKNIGGAAGATVVEGKLSPYYDKLGLNQTSLTVDEDHNFIFNLGRARLKGKITKDEDGSLVFEFNAFGKIKLGKMTAHATKAGSTLNLTFDATRLIQIVTKVAGVLNNSTIKALTDLINSYDGIYLGFKLKAE